MNATDGSTVAVAGRPNASVPLIVDLDGTLIKSDLLLESALECLATRTRETVARTVADLSRGVPGLLAWKSWLADNADIDVSRLPYRQDMLDRIDVARRAGREIWLVSASDHRLVVEVADHLGIFDGAQGSSGTTNLKGANKSDWLQNTFPAGFDYAGDSRADLPVWRQASGALLVGQIAKSRRVEGNVVDRLAEVPASPAVWLSALRVHHWVKNILLMIPFLLSGQWMGATALPVFLGFVTFSLMASGTYLINDLLDLQTDRAHWAKRYRPIASGRISPFLAMFSGAGLIIGGLLAIWTLSVAAGVLATAYLSINLVYSIHVKRVPFLDLAALAGMFTLRLGVGIALAGLVYSPWLLSFAAVFFFSLSALKRSAEFRTAYQRGWARLHRRGYQVTDGPLIQTIGISFSAISLLIMVFYLLTEAATSGDYPNPQWLWLAPVATLVWLCRIWYVSSRGEMPGDPVMFAVRDRLSLASAVVLLAGVLCAHLR